MSKSVSLLRSREHVCRSDDYVTRYSFIYTRVALDWIERSSYEESYTSPRFLHIHTTLPQGFIWYFDGIDLYNLIYEDVSLHEI